MWKRRRKWNGKTTKTQKNPFSMKFRIAPNSMKQMHRLNVVIYDRTAFPLRLFEKKRKKLSINNKIRLMCPALECWAYNTIFHMRKQSSQTRTSRNFIVKFSKMHSGCHIVRDWMQNGKLGAIEIVWKWAHQFIVFVPNWLIETNEQRKHALITAAHAVAV